ncbi:zinc ribbon domain-containing protein [Euzebya sp.]|uniref:zinc ribbon domain-containing protein n=1 Tax=Euzebya sp. TaxID=1971409 RepID=UPI003518AD7B
MRCPSCGATNPEGARFCGQCYEVFDAPRREDPDPAQPGRPEPDEPGPASPTAPSTARPVAVGRFASVDGEMVWRCAVCDTTNPSTTFSCDVCGARMDAEEGAGPDVDWAAARRRELLLPGLGHLAAGQAGMGAARMGIAALWLLGAFALALGGTAGLLAATPLVVGMSTIWVTGPGDLDAARAGRPPRLDARRFMYLVIGVTVGVIVLGGLGALI